LRGGGRGTLGGRRGSWGTMNAKGERLPENAGGGLPRAKF
jgi:hypothetical protein